MGGEDRNIGERGGKIERRRRKEKIGRRKEKRDLGEGGRKREIWVKEEKSKI